MRNVVVLITFLLGTLPFLWAGNGTWSNRVPLEDLWSGNSYGIYEPTWSAQDVKDYERYQGFVYLDYTRKEHSDLYQSNEWRLTVTFTYFDENSVLQTVDVVIGSEEGNWKYTDYEEVTFLQADLGYEIVVKGVSGEYKNGSTWIPVANPQLDPHFPDDIDLRLELRSEEWYHLQAISPNPELLSMVFNAQEYRARWSFVEGAEYYDFEWVWIDAESAEHNDLVTSMAGAYGYLQPFLAKEPSRVRLWSTHFNMDQTYSQGTLYFRVRPVSQFIVSNEVVDQVMTGEWTYFATNTGYNPSTGTYNAANLIKHAVDANESFEYKKNWLYGVAYAENGKSVSSLTYYDGSNRGRQSLTYNTSDNITLIGETKFDYEGRQTLSIIPAPVNGRQLGYRSGFNLVDAGGSSLEEFNETHFDKDDYITSPAPPLAIVDPNNGTTLGAAQYFSPENQFVDDLFRDAIPNANGYVYSQTIYRNDGSGRIERVGGIGEEFQVGGVHAVQTFYGTPLQAELKRLFGSNVADDPKGYRKEMVRDANGQHSVTYYDKRGNVIATGLSGESPLNLLELDGVLGTEITSPLANSMLTDPYTLVSENTFLNEVENAVITLDYDLTGAVNSMNAQTISVQGQLFSVGAICESCEYKLTIEVLTQDGEQIIASGQLDPYVQYISSEDACIGAEHLVSLQYQLTTPGEYRIIKRLSFEPIIIEPPLPSLEDFLDDYTENIDLSGCYNTCDEYCEGLKKFEYDQENGVGSWDALSQSAKDVLIQECIETECDPDEFNQSFGGDPNSPIGQYINPYDNSCDAMRERMKDQISPGGLFYDDPQSQFWACVESHYFPNGDEVYNINGTDYNWTQVQDPSLYNEALANLFIGCHREACHLLTCEDWASTMDYSNAQLPYLTGSNVNWPTSAGGTVFATPYDIVVAPYIDGDPFLTQEWNGTNEDVLQYVLTNYINPTNELDCPYNSDPVLTSGTLYQHVEHIVSCLQSFDPTVTDDLKKLIFKTLYDDAKLRLIKLYKDDQEYELFTGITQVGCPYFYDDDAVFIGPMSQDQMEDYIDDQLSDMFNGTDCAETAWANVLNWTYQMPQACLDALESNGDYDPDYTETDLTGSVNSGNLEQLFYDYSIAGCPENTWGWFFDPQLTNSSDPWQAAYDDINLLMSTTTGCLTALETIEVDTPGSVTLETTDQSISDCGLAFIEMLNDGINEMVDNTTFPLPECGPLFGSTSFQGNLIINSTNYPQLYNAPCGISGTADFGICEDDNGFVSHNFALDLSGSGGCDMKVYVLMTEDYWENCATAYITSLQSPVKYSSFTYDRYIYNSLTQTIDFVVQSTLIDAIVLEATFSNGHTGYVYFETTGVSCLSFGSFDDLSVDTFDPLPIPVVNVTENCIEATIGQALIDGAGIYNNMTNEVQNMALQSGLVCSNVEETFTITYFLKEYQYTLYYYDLAGNLVQTVPPQGVYPLDQMGLDNGDNPDHLMETRYQYNGLNTLIAQYTPDGGHSDFYLDKLYRVRYSQNADQNDKNKASYSQYDELGRIEEAGEMKLPVVADVGVYLTGAVEDNLPTGAVKMDYTHTWYEEIYPLDNSIAAQFSSGEQENLRNAIGAVMHYQADYDYLGALIDGSEVVTVISYSYDAHKNVQEMVSTNYDLVYLGQQHKHIGYTYDLMSGNVNEVVYQQGQADEYRHRYHYDANNRLIRAFTSTDGIWWDMDGKYFYYLHGSLARTEIGHDKVQGTDYAYNLQGWLKGVNSSTLSASRDLGKDAADGMNKYVGIDAHGYMLGYYANDYSSIGTTSAFASTAGVQALNQHNGSDAYSSLYNGNITHMVTAMRDLEEEVIPVLANNYRYDQLQRIKAMDVYEDQNLQATNNFNSAGLYNGGGYQTRYNFDKNGNLTYLMRHGSGEGTTGLEMDEFTYNYYDSSDPLTGTLNDTKHVNRLAQVSDNGTYDGNYTDDIKSGQGTENYTYNASGQLIGDEQEDIEEIVWTVTGKVKEIRFTTASGKDNLKFIYDPMDMRIAKIQYNDLQHSTVEYTYYSYDAQGNAMATYERKTEYSGTISSVHKYDDAFSLDEQMIYGASRLGVRKPNKLLASAIISQTGEMGAIDYDPNTSYELQNLPEVDESHRQVGMKYYELSNHLGNVLTVVTDRKLGFTNYELVFLDEFDEDGDLLGWVSGDGIIGTPDVEYSLSASSGSLTLESGSGFGYTFKSVFLESGVNYVFSFDISGSGVSTGVEILADENGSLLYEFITTSGPHTFSFVGNGQQSWIGFSADYQETVSIDNVKLEREGVLSYTADVVSYSDYYPYGMLLDGRHGSEEDYRYGFQGQEKENEISGEGNNYSAQFWIYDSRLGRRWDTDPVVKYHESPYSSFANNPICFIDPSGADTIEVHQQRLNDNSNILITNIGKVDMSDESILYVRSYDADGNLMYEGNDFQVGTPEYDYGHRKVKVWVGSTNDPSRAGITKEVEAWQAWEHKSGADRYMNVHWRTDGNGQRIQQEGTGIYSPVRYEWEAWNIRPKSYLSFEVLFENDRVDYSSNGVVNWSETKSAIGYLSGKVSEFEGGNASTFIPQNGRISEANRPVKLSNMMFVVVGYHSPEPTGREAGNTNLAIDRANTVALRLGAKSTMTVMGKSGGEKTRSAMVYLLFKDQGKAFINGIDTRAPTIGE